jgi:hypothetical protein
MKMNTKTVRKIADKEVYKHEKSMHGVKKMKAGGPTGMDMRKMGRNAARAANQRGG